MEDSLLVKKTISIKAPPSKVWEVLTRPEFIKQWDELPDDFGNAPLSKGSVINWEGYSKLTVTGFEPGKLLKMKLYAEKWEKPEAAYDVAYTFAIDEKEGHTSLLLSIGDFAVLPNGQPYYEASLEFADTATKKIKELSEG